MAKEKQPLTAVQRGKRGALIGMILVEIIMVLMIFVESSNIIEVIGGILIAGFGGALYGFGYAFGIRWLLGWAAGALHYSGHVLDAGFLWWICTGRKEGIIRGLIFSMFLISAAVCFAWIPGVVKGIKDVRAEKKNSAAETTGYAVEGKKAGKPWRLKKAEKQQDETALPTQNAAILPTGQEQNAAVKSVSAQSQTVSAQPQPMMAINQAAAGIARYVDCYGGEFNGASFDMKDILQLAIGRNPQLCRVILNQSGISRVHCLIQYRRDGMYVQDLSTNGTYLLNGARLPKGTFVPVKIGDGVRLGQQGPEFRFR